MVVVLSGIVVAGAAPDPWPAGFHEGLATLTGVGALPPSSSCASCHPDQYAQWERSRHHGAATNTVFVDGLKQEPHARCMNCHAPVPGGVRDLARTIGPRPQPLPTTSPAHEGISCAVCHVRDGVVVSAGPGRGYGHDVRPLPALKDAAFCAACHEFSGHEMKDGVTTLNDLPMQSTYSEWRAWRERTGDERTCQACHMPGGRHDFDGTSQALLRRSLEVSFERHGSDVDAVVDARDVGHRFPTGDVFRHLTLHIEDATGERRELFRFERRTALVDGDAGLRQVIASDTRLVPGEPRRLRLPDDARAVVVTFHRADDKAEARGRVSYDELVDELVTLPVPR